VLYWECGSEESTMTRSEASGECRTTAPDNRIDTYRTWPWNVCGGGRDRRRVGRWNLVAAYGERGTDGSSEPLFLFPLSLALGRVARCW